MGTITSIELNDSSQAVVEMEVEDDLAPLHQGTTATIRATSLSGIANRYVSLDPGPNDAGEIDDGGRIGADDTSAPVDLDQLFNTLDPKTRKGLQQFVQGSATYYGGRSKEASESLKYFSPALSATSRLTREIVIDEGVFERFITDTSRLVGALAERRTDLAALVGNANTTARAIGGRERGAGAGARPAARHAPQGQHDLREPARGARRPRRARGRVQARHQGPGAVPARRCGRSCRRAADDRRPARADQQAAARTTT